MAGALRILAIPQDANSNTITMPPGGAPEIKEDV